ncbi:MAG: AMP-binding protein [Alphaproteobacteria bacterium]|nr:AMP-binding protein [Alphaproteobacteria bacterium]
MPQSTTPPSYNIAALMEQQAAERPHQRAVVFPAGRDAAGHVAWTQLSFAQLNALTDRYAHGLVARGVRQGDRVSLLVKPCLEFIPLVFAVFKVGALPVLIDPGMGRQQFLSCLERMAPTVLIAEPVVHVLKHVFRAPFRGIKASISTGSWGGVTLSQLEVHGQGPFPTVQVGEHDEAAILFTSGSTGPAKGVTYTHGIFSAQAAFIRDMYDIRPGEIDLACFPLFGLFSMAIGMTVVIPDMDPTKPAQADPVKLLEAIQDHGCTSGAGSPSIWKNLGRYCVEHELQLPSLKRLLMFGAPIPVWMHEQFQQIFTDGAQIHTPYGATESLPVATIGTREVLSETHARTRAGAGTCVGRELAAMTVRIIEITDDAIETWDDAVEVTPGRVGEITVRGPIVTPEYKDLPDKTALAKIREALPDGTTAVVHRMGDLGYRDEQGRLWFCGRKSHRVVTADGGVVFPVPVEGVFNEHADVARTALVGVNGRPVLCVELEPGRSRPFAEIEAELRELGRGHDVSAVVGDFLQHPAFPVDVRHNAKIHRLQLREWAAAKLGEPVEHRPEGEV